MLGGEKITVEEARWLSCQAEKQDLYDAADIGNSLRAGGGAGKEDADGNETVAGKRIISLMKVAR